MNFIKKNLLILCFAICTVCEPQNVWSQAACNNGFTQSEQEVWSIFTAQTWWWDFVLWQYRTYRMFEDKWGDWGFRQADDLNQAYAKAVNASFLLSYGLNEDRNSQWHGTIDYCNAGVALATANHYQIHYEPSTSRLWLALATNTGHTKMGCALFDANGINAIPSDRAADYVHEGWHHWQKTRNYVMAHLQGPVGACSLSTKGCDWYYWHSVGTYEFGEMHKYSANGAIFHSPTQAQVEFLCDIAENSADFVPASVRLMAESEANQRITTRFVNQIPYLCGDPRPW